MSADRDHMPPDWTTAEGREVLAAIEHELWSTSKQDGAIHAPFCLVHDLAEAPANVVNVLLCPMNHVPTHIADLEPEAQIIARVRLAKGV